MKKLHIIHTKKLNEIKPQNRGKALPILEKHTLEWAQKAHKKAYSATIEVKKAAKEDAKLEAKYFKYLRRLLELKLKYCEDNVEEGSKFYVPEDIKELLEIESLRIPKHISCTQIDLWESCPRKWYYQYALGIKFPKTAALHFGVAVDEALNFYFEEKAEGREAPRSAVYASFYEHFNDGRSKVNWGDVSDKQLERNGPAILDAYLDRFAKRTNPRKKGGQYDGIQTEAIVHLDNGGVLLGYLDILELEVIVDTKTAKEKWKTTGPFAKHKNALQPLAYSLWYYQEHDEMPKGFRYQIVTKETDADGNPTPQTQEIELRVKKYEVEAFKRRIQKVWDDINKAIKVGKSAFPAQAEVGLAPGRGLGCVNPGVLCCDTWCDYSEYCKKDGLRIPTHWVSKTKKTKNSPAIRGHHHYADSECNLCKGHND